MDPKRTRAIELCTYAFTNHFTLQIICILPLRYVTHNQYKLINMNKRTLFQAASRVDYWFLATGLVLGANFYPGQFSGAPCV